jgi:hypothetical protein
MLFSKPCRFVLFFAYLISANAEPTVDLGTAGDYVILAETGISTVPQSIITGDIAVSPIARGALTGFALVMAGDGTSSTSTQITGKAYAADYAVPTPAVLTVAVGDMGTAYTDAAGRVNLDTSRINLNSGLIGGLTLTPGIYTFVVPVTINSDITIQGGADDIFIIQMTGNLIFATNTKVILDVPN